MNLRSKFLIIIFYNECFIDSHPLHIIIVERGDYKYDPFNVYIEKY